MQLSEWLDCQRSWSLRVFGPGPRTKGILKHIEKELDEIEADPGDPMEWVDVMILAFDGAWRCKDDQLAWNARLLGERFRVMPFPVVYNVRHGLREVERGYFPMVYSWLRIAEGARRQLEKMGYTWEEILTMLEAKQHINMFERTWPALGVPQDQTTEHAREENHATPMSRH